MGNIKEIFKILVIIQLLACSLAYYGHPDAETIDFGSPTQPSREQTIIEAAIKRGMDGEAVAELLRTKQPVIRTTTTPNGVTKTTTYNLEDDGSISRKTVTQKRNHFVYNAANVPDSIPIDELQKSPTGTVTRTFTDADGNKVTQTIAIDKPKPATDLGNDDWFNKPFPSWPATSSFDSSAPSHWFTEFDKPTSYGHRTVTRTFTGPNGEKRVVQTTSNNPPSTLEQPNRPKYPKIGDINWPNFDESSFGKPWDRPNTDDSDDWVVVEDNPNVETTTKKKIPSWTPKTWEWPEFTTPTTTTTTTNRKVFIEPESNTPQPFPSLDDFLKSQYGPSTTTTKTQTFSSTSFKTTTPISTTSTASSTTKSTKKPTIINIDDLPVTQILHNGKPANDSILKSLPPHLKPTRQNEEVLKIEHKHPIEEDIEVFTPKVETNIRTYSKTLTGSEKPSLKDLDPHMQEVLRKAGINPDDITNIDGDTITKTRTEPDGRVITTTYKVNSRPVEHTVPVSHYTPPQFSAHSFDSFKPYQGSHTPLTPFASGLSSISEFLAKLGLTKFDISSRSGQYSKTFIDDNGDVLTATFVLSNPKNIKVVEPPKPKPYK